MTQTATKFSNLIDAVEPEKLSDFRTFIKELNERERWVRFDKAGSFNEYKVKGKHGWGFSIDGNAVPYFHPNRSFHDEIIWLNERLFYDPTATLADKVINAGIVKFYGPSRTLEIITENTPWGYVKADEFFSNEDYQLQLCSNMENSKEKIYGTTELRTSLQTAARNYGRAHGSSYDVVMPETLESRLVRKIRRSDILNWFRYIGPMFVEYYQTKPTMRGSFDHLTSHRGIGNYYGYHFSSNLARMPEVGTLVREGSKIGNLSEDDPFVIAGVGAASSLEYLFGKGNAKRNQSLIQEIRHNQDEWFDFKSSDGSAQNAKLVTELGFFTHFGIEISLCQWGVYRRIRENRKMAANRAKAPISTITKK